MEQYIIKGGHPLVGEVEIGGAKNAALAILAAAIMTDETVRICLLYTSDAAVLRTFQMLMILMYFWMRLQVLEQWYSVQTATLLRSMRKQFMISILNMIILKRFVHLIIC